MSKVLGSSVGIIAAGIAFIILYPILGVTLWVSFLVAACVLVAATVTSTHSAAH